jgi:hypothetical protein
VPIRFEIMRRKFAFLQYILKQEKSAMISQVLKATRENSVKHNFVQTCMKYLKTLDISLNFEEIEKLSDRKFKKLLKEKSKVAAFNYLKKEQSKQTKIMDIHYDKLEIQEYLLCGDRDINISRLILKARGLTLDIKTQKKWIYSDRLCSGCTLNDESGNEILFCKSFGKNIQKISYSWFYRESVSDQILVAQIMMKKLKAREKLREEQDKIT